jgi:hypothetical protein
MAEAKMSVAELEKFLHEEFPQAFSDGDITIESADGQTCLLRQRYSERMLRPGGTVSGPTLMAMADFAMYVVLLSAIGPCRPGGNDQSQHQFPAQGAAGTGRAGRGAAAEAGQAPRDWGGQPAVGLVPGPDRPCDGDLFHSKYVGFLEVI